MPTKKLPGRIPAVELTERRRAVESTIGTMRIEGTDLEPEDLELLDCYAQGEIDLVEFRARMKASAGKIQA